MTMRFVFNTQEQQGGLEEAVRELKHADQLFHVNKDTLIPLYAVEQQLAFYPPRVIIRKVSKYVIGDGILGRAFPDVNVAEILDTLQGEDVTKVRAHELYHLNNRSASEYAVRVATGTLHYEPNQYVSIT